MEFALFLGCNIPARVQQYEISARAVLHRLNVTLVDIDGFKCCGYPIRNMDVNAFMLFSARNLALAERQNLPIMTLCKCCFGTLKKAAHDLKENTQLKDMMNSYLKKEGLSYTGDIDVTHFLSVLHKDIGLVTLKDNITRPLQTVKIAAHYGCHALRPSDIMQFDDPIAPVVFDDLVAITGAANVDWQMKLECCGAPLLGINDELSMDLTGKKISDGKQSGADYLCTACPWCQLQFDTLQTRIPSRNGNGSYLPSLVYPQLLGLVMGLDSDALGMNMNRIDILGIQDHLAPAKIQESK